MRATCTREDCGRPAFGRGLCAKHYQYARKHGELPTVPDERPCEHCGTPFSSRKWNARYCSERCNWNASAARERKARGYRADQCEHCGKDLPADRRTHMRFCSERCGDAWRNAQKGAERLAAKAALQRTCQGCGAPLAATERATRLYCSEQCKSDSRRHEAYRLTKKELDALLAQHETCAICQTSEWGRKGPQVDHDHLTGAVRGVLCGNCNQGLGRFGDDPARLRAAAEYLEMSSGGHAPRRPGGPGVAADRG